MVAMPCNELCIQTLLVQRKSLVSVFGFGNGMQRGNFGPSPRDLSSKKKMLEFTRSLRGSEAHGV